MTAVITEQQARQITGGRKPLMPIEYEEACKMLDACVSLDDAKYWADKSDALAAWAKIYHDDIASIKAKKIKLKAYRRLGELAMELAPKRRATSERGAPPGPQQLLTKNGLTQGHARQAVAVARAPIEKFENAVEMAYSPRRVEFECRGLGSRKAVRSDSWMWLTAESSYLNSPRLRNTLASLRNKSAKSVATGISPDEVAKARELVVGLQEWLDEFEQYLPKAPPSE